MHFFYVITELFEYKNKSSCDQFRNVNTMEVNFQINIL